MFLAIHTKKYTTWQQIFISENFEAMELARVNKVYFCMLPPNATHLFQPLDVAVFAPMKASWRRELENWQKESHVTNMPKKYFILLLARLFKSCSENFAENLKSGFWTCGLYPLDTNEILRKLLKTITEAQADQSLNETLIDLLQKNRSDKRVTKKSRGERVRAGVIVNTELGANYVSDSSSEEENVDDGTMCKICSVKWIDLTENSGIWVQCDICWWLHMP